MAVLGAACILMLVGIFQLAKAKYDVFPNFAVPTIVVQTEASGYSSQQVEKFVTIPLESALQGMRHVDHLRSSSIQGLSVITIFCDSEGDAQTTRNLVNERLSNLGSALPVGVRPIVTPETSSTSVVAVIGITASRKGSIMEMRRFTDTIIKPRLESIRGIAKVVVFGGEVKQLQIQIQPERLVEFDLSISDVISAARQSFGVLNGGFSDTANQRIILHTADVEYTPESLSSTVLSVPAANSRQVAVTFGEIARIAYAPEPPLGAATVNGAPGIQLIVSAAPGANSYEVNEKLFNAIHELEPETQRHGYLFHDNIFSQSKFINHSLGDFKFSFVIGLVLVALVLILFLSDHRLAWISCMAIPISILTAATVLNAFGFTFNVMTLGGLAIAVGEVVDDAVIDVENITRRLRLNSSLPNPLPVLKVIFAASTEVRSSVVYASLAILVIFIPIIMMPGLAGKMFLPLALAYVLSTAASLIVALTVTPVLCFLLLEKKSQERGSRRIINRLKQTYSVALNTLHSQVRWIVFGMAFLLCAAIISLKSMSSGFLPELHEGHYIVHMALLPGTSLEESMRLGNRVTGELMRLPFVQTVSQRAGRAENSDDVLGTHYSEFEVEFKPDLNEDEESAVSQMRSVLVRFPGAHFSINSFLTERIEETLSNSRSPVVINVYGNTAEDIDTTANAIAELLRQTPGAIDVKIENASRSPCFFLEPDLSKLSQWGLKLSDVADAIATIFQGVPVGQTYEGNFPQIVSVILDPAKRKTLNIMDALPLRSPTGTYIHLGDITSAKQSMAPYEIVHESGRRVQTVSCNIQGGDVKGFVAKVKKEVSSKIKMNTSVHLEFRGEAEAQSEALKSLIFYSCIAAVALIFIISLALHDKRNLILILINLPFTMIGAVMGAMLAGSLSIGSLVGFVTVFGISARNSMMLVCHYENLVLKEGEVWSWAAAMRGASERFIPIMMTATATGLAMLPIAVMHEYPGFEIEGPMALVVLLGLVTSTLLNLFILPSLAFHFGRFRSAASDAINSSFDV